VPVFRSKREGMRMLHGKGPREIALTNSAVLLLLLQRLIDGKLLPREEALALLGDAADELMRDPKQVTDVHVLATDIIREELVPRV
jgi:urease gamma subunit